MASTNVCLMTMIRLPSEPGYEKVAMASAATVAKRMGFPPERIDDIKTIVAEACLNAIEHGNALNVSLPVTIELYENGAGLEIRVSDTGQNPMRASLPCPGSHPAHRHWGIFLIEHLADELSFDSTPQGGNAIRVRLNLLTQALPA